MSARPFAEWPQEHRNLLAAAGLFVVFVGIAYVVFFRARIQELSDSRRALAKTQKKLQETSWPNDAGRLKRLLDGYKRDLEGTKTKQGLKQLAETTLEHCTSLFSEKIKDAYGNDDNFKEKASQVEFKDEIDKLDSYLQGKGIFLAKTIFGLDETSLDSSKYQMLLKVWTTEKIVNLALEHKLTVGVSFKKEDKAGPRNDKRGALITALPINSYILNSGDKQPYLLEIPIKITVAGNMSRFLDFAEALQSEETFLPMTRLEIQSFPPGDSKGNAEGFLVHDRIQATIVCSAFYRPQGGKLPQSSKALKKPPLPPGA